MGYMTVYSPCFVCKRPFHSNPQSVPSYEGEPICSTCIVVVNEERAKKGMPLWPVAADAYEPLEVEG
jgi:hypothetical protein